MLCLKKFSEEKVTPVTEPSGGGRAAGSRRRDSINAAAGRPVRAKSIVTEHATVTVSEQRMAQLISALGCNEDATLKARITPNIVKNWFSLAQVGVHDPVFAQMVLTFTDLNQLGSAISDNAAAGELFDLFHARHARQIHRRSARG